MRFPGFLRHSKHNYGESVQRAVLQFYTATLRATVAPLTPARQRPRRAPVLLKFIDEKIDFRPGHTSHSARLPLDSGARMSVLGADGLEVARSGEMTFDLSQPLPGEKQLLKIPTRKSWKLKCIVHKMATNAKCTQF
ncbi:hypothetical protein CBL_06828 [Carabus blaptoides fortunei]